MKRKNNLYQEICKFENIVNAFNEVCRNTKNKRKVAKCREYKCIYISRIQKILESKTYKVGPYNVFTIYDPKKRRIVSQSIEDKIINHLISRFILYPALMSCLIDSNVASRKYMGTKKGLELSKKFHRICKVKYGTYYILKCDISKFFSSINHDILKKKLKTKIKDKDALNIVFSVIDSDNDGLSIGNMTSQVLAIFYLNDLDHFIKETLKIKYYVRYQDDFLLFHHSKEYLKYCLNQIKVFLEKENLCLNNKTRIFKNTDNFIFLGRTTENKYAKYRTVKRRLKKRFYLYHEQKISLNSLVCSINSYNTLLSGSSKI